MALSENLRGASLMVAGMATFALSDACMKGLGARMPLFQAMALRGLGVSAVLGVLAWRQRSGWRVASRRDLRLMGGRALAEMAVAWSYLSALVLMPIANVSAIFQASPLAMTLAGALLLRERVSRARWGAIALGFLGVLLIVRPGAGAFGLPSMLVLASVAFVTLRDLLSRGVSSAVPSVLVAAVTAWGVTLFALAGSTFVDWAPVTGQGTLLLGGAVVLLVLGYVLIVAAMRRGEVSFVSPFRYASLIASMAAGFLFFGTFPDGVTLLGAATVVGSGVAVLATARADRPAPPEAHPEP